MQLRILEVASLIAMSLSLASAQSKVCPTLETNVSDSRFKPGQVWTYQNRTGESGSTVTVLKIDRSEKMGIIIHVRVDGLNAHNPNGDVVPSVEQMPFTRDAMLRSTVRLLREGVSIPTLEGYERWRADCGGVYTISIADAVGVMEKTLKSR